MERNKNVGFCVFMMMIIMIMMSGKKYGVFFHLSRYVQYKWYVCAKLIMMKMKEKALYISK